NRFQASVARVCTGPDRSSSRRCCGGGSTDAATVTGVRRVPHPPVDTSAGAQLEVVHGECAAGGSETHRWTVLGAHLGIGDVVVAVHRGGVDPVPLAVVPAVGGQPPPGEGDGE